MKRRAEGIQFEMGTFNKYIARWCCSHVRRDGFVHDVVNDMKTGFLQQQRVDDMNANYVKLVQQ